METQNTQNPTTKKCSPLDYYYYALAIVFVAIAFVYPLAYAFMVYIATKYSL